MTHLKFSIKQLSTGNNVSTIKVEHNKISNSIDAQLRSLAVLIGGYNQFGRKIDIVRYNELKSQFEEIISEISDIID